MRCSIIIPCYNESGNLKELLRQVMILIDKYDVEIVLVENGSADNSKHLFETLPEMQHERLTKVYVTKNRGYGYGLIQGLKACKGEYVGWVHADMSVSIEEIAIFLEYIEKQDKEADCFLKGNRKNRNGFDLFFTFFQGVFETVLFGTYMYDIGATPVFFPKDMLVDYDVLPYDFSIELYVYYVAKKKCLNIKRFPVYMRERKAGISSWNRGVKSKVKWSLKIIDDSVKIKKGVQVI